MLLAAKVVLAYLIGSVSGSLLMGRVYGGVDIRTQGSGNAGGTNALRTQGPLFALGVIVVDIGKGALAAGPVANAFGADATAALACAAAAVFGHCYPIWHGFRGGKGAATLVGTIAVLHWPYLVPLFLGWVAVIALTGYVGLATMTAAVGLAAWAILQPAAPQPGFAWFAAAMAAFIVFTHRSNLLRMIRGTENRNRSLWLAGRLLRRG